MSFTDVIFDYKTGSFSPASTKQSPEVSSSATKKRSTPNHHTSHLQSSAIAVLFLSTNMQSVKLILGTSVIILFLFSFPKSYGFRNDICSRDSQLTCQDQPTIYHQFEKYLNDNTVRNVDVRRERLLQIRTINDKDRDVRSVSRDVSYFNSRLDPESINYRQNPEQYRITDRRLDKRTLNSERVQIRERNPNTVNRDPRFSDQSARRINSRIVDSRRVTKPNQISERNIHRDNEKVFCDAPDRIQIRERRVFLNDQNRERDTRIRNQESRFVNRRLVRANIKNSDEPEVIQTTRQNSERRRVTERTQDNVRNVERIVKKSRSTDRRLSERDVRENNAQISNRVRSNTLRNNIDNNRIHSEVKSDRRNNKREDSRLSKRSVNNSERSTISRERLETERQILDRRVSNTRFENNSFDRRVRLSERRQSTVTERINNQPKQETNRNLQQRDRPLQDNSRRSFQQREQSERQVRFSDKTRESRNYFQDRQRLDERSIREVERRSSLNHRERSVAGQNRREHSIDRTIRGTERRSVDRASNNRERTDSKRLSINRLADQVYRNNIRERETSVRRDIRSRSFDIIRTERNRESEKRENRIPVSERRSIDTDTINRKIRDRSLNKIRVNDGMSESRQRTFNERRNNEIINNIQREFRSVDQIRSVSTDRRIVSPNSPKCEIRSRFVDNLNRDKRESRILERRDSERNINRKTNERRENRERQISERRGDERITDRSYNNIRLKNYRESHEHRQIRERETHSSERRLSERRNNEFNNEREVRIRSVDRSTVRERLVPERQIRSTINSRKVETARLLRNIRQDGPNIREKKRRRILQDHQLIRERRSTDRSSKLDVNTDQRLNVRESRDSGRIATRNTQIRNKENRLTLERNSKIVRNTDRKISIRHSDFERRYRDQDIRSISREIREARSVENKNVRVLGNSLDRRVVDRRISSRLPADNNESRFLSGKSQKATNMKTYSRELSLPEKKEQIPTRTLQRNNERISSIRQKRDTRSMERVSERRFKIRSIDRNARIDSKEQQNRIRESRNTIRDPVQDRKIRISDRRLKIRSLERSSERNNKISERRAEIRDSRTSARRISSTTDSNLKNLRQSVNQKRFSDRTVPEERRIIVEREISTVRSSTKNADLSRSRKSEKIIRENRLLNEGIQNCQQNRYNQENIIRDSKDELNRRNSERLLDYNLRIKDSRYRFVDQERLRNKQTIDMRLNERQMKIMSQDGFQYAPNQREMSVFRLTYPTNKVQDVETNIWINVVKILLMCLLFLQISQNKTADLKMFKCTRFSLFSQLFKEKVQ